MGVSNAARKPRKPLSGILILLLLLLAWGAGGLSAQTPLECTPPRLERFTPAVVAHAEIPADVAGTAPVAVAVDAEGTPWGSRIAADGEPLPALPPAEAAEWRPAHGFSAPVPGARWKTAPGAFHFELDPTRTIPPEPRFQIERIPAEKFALVARVVEKGILRLDVTVGKDGQLRDLKAWDARLESYAQDLFKAVTKGGAAFAPARDRTTGEAVDVTGQFRWDLRANPPTGVVWDTAMIAWDALEGPDASVDLVVEANGQGGVESSWLMDPSLADHPDLHEVLLSSLVMPFAAEEPGALAIWTFRIQPAEGLVQKYADRPVERTTPVMLAAPRPEYPRRLWRRGPEGYVYVRYEITREGRIADIRILESTEDAFARAARDALQQWRFEPMRFDGEPIRSEVIMTLPFRLPPR